MTPAGRHDGRTQLVWAPLVATCQIDGGRPQLLLLYIVDFGGLVAFYRFSDLVRKRLSIR